jgi:hypothetical protein
MAFHPDKRNIFRVTTKKSPQHFYYNMHGHILESVQSAKYLGVKLSADLNWNNHIQQMTSKANKSLSFIRRNLQIYSKSVKCSKNVVGIFWLLLWRCYVCLGEMPLGTDHLTWRGGYGFLFCSEQIFRTTQELEYYFFCRAIFFSII